MALPAAAGAAQASAASITVPTGCIIYNQATATNGVPITGTGFTASDFATFTTTPGGEPAGGEATDANGNFTGTFDPPAVTTPGATIFTLSAVDSNMVTATATFTEAPLALDVKPAEAKPNQKVRFTFSGFTAGAPLYVHYVHKGKVVETTRLGTTQGACGVFSDRMTILPKKLKPGNYTAQFDDARTYSKTSSPKIDAPLSKTRTMKF